jgi:hypothetical protein
VVADVIDSGWWHTSTFGALGYRFALRSQDQELHEVVQHLFEACRIDATPDAVYEVRREGGGPDDRVLYVDGERIAGIDRPSWLLGYLSWHVNHEVIERSTQRFVLVHAAAASRDGHAVVLPGVPEAGKTTLVAGLVRSGWHYLTDEAVALDPQTHAMEPYPKPLTIDPGSWDVLADLAPAFAMERFSEDQWRVAPQDIRADVVGQRCPISMIVFPTYREGAATSVEPMRRSEALLGLLRNTFAATADGRRNLLTLAAVVERAPAFRLVSGDLYEALGAVHELTQGVGAGR